MATLTFDINPVSGKPAQGGNWVFGVEQNHPNPFNPSTTIRYALGDNADVSLIVYNVLGQEVRRLVNAAQVPGAYHVDWDGKDGFGRQVSNGMYLYRLVAGQNVVLKKMVFAK